MLSSSPSSGPDTVLDREIEAIVALLRQEGPLTRTAIRTRLETRLWGPGRLGAALAEARRRGDIRRTRWRTYAASDD